MSQASADFARPPLDGTLTVDRLCDWHRIHSPDIPAFVFPKEIADQDGQMAHMTWKSLGEGIIRGVDLVRCHVPETKGGKHPVQREDPIVVGILAVTDTISYTTLLYSHLYLTHEDTLGRPVVPFPISTRNSPAAVAHLIQLANVKYLWVTDGPMRTLADEALHREGPADTIVLSFPSFSELYPGPSTSSTHTKFDIENKHYTAASLDQPALILHSSGKQPYLRVTTVPIADKNHLLVSLSFEQGDLNVHGEILAVHGLPIFHAMGLFASLFATASGLIRAVPSPRAALPPTTPETLLEQIVKSNSSILICVPSFLEEWSIEPKSVQTLAKMKAILWGGAPLKAGAGQLLHKEGVPIHNLYGATEFGVISFMAAKPYQEGYEWFKLAPHVSPDFVPETDEENVFEVVFKECATHHLSAINTEVNGVPAYSTNDILERHKSNSDMFRIRGRKDDQIMLSTGEKTNPGPLESIINKNPHVKNALLFGRGRLSNGVLVEPASYDEARDLGSEVFRNMIWPSIEEANAYAPAHSRIFKEMILVAVASKPFLYTAKESVRRGVTLNNYAQEIEEIYKAVHESSNIDIPVPSCSSEEGGWTLEEILGFVRKAVHAIMKGAEELGDEDDIFVFGCDSLQATHIRNTIRHALRQVAPPANVQKVPPNFVYQHPTIRDLATFAAQISRSSMAVTEVDVEAARNELLDALVTKYTKDWPAHRPSKDASDPTSEVILLTGSTGGLGSQLLAQLVMMPSVSHIYAFNRPVRSGKTSRDRHVEAFMDRGNDVALLDSEKIVCVEGDTAAEGFGVAPELFSEIRDSVTTIIHNAWRVDFNISLSSFEPAIRGVRGMIDLALQSPHSSPPRVMFTSSVGIVKAWSDIPSVAESPVTDLSLVTSSGYAESKWVSERLLWTAGQSTTLRPIIVRVGQLSGGINGNWNVREWFPALTRASQFVNGVPDNRGLVSFLPLHVAASALIELRHTSSQFVHLVHPRPVPWRTIIQHVADALNVPVLPYNVWLERLEALPRTNEALDRNPALHLLGFYRSSATPGHVRYVEEQEAMGLAMYETKNTVAEAPALGASRLSQLGKEDVNRWITYWKSKGALDA